MTSGLHAGQPRRLESHPSSLQPHIHQIGRRDFGQIPPSGQSLMQPHPLQYSPHTNLIPPYTSRTLHQTMPEPRPRRNISVFDIRDENITDAEARKRLSSFIVVRIDRSTDRYDVDDEGNPTLPSWGRASHIEQRDISQEEAGRKVRQLNRETKSVTDKKNGLSSAIQRQLEHAWNKLDDTETDPRFVYTLAQLDWKPKRVETTKGRDRKHDRRSKDKKRSKEGHKSKRSPSRSRPKKERVSITAYFRREPGRNENCAMMLKAQQMERREGGSLPMMIPGQPPRQRSVNFHPTHSPLQSQTRQYDLEPQVQCHFPLNQPSGMIATHSRGSAPPPPPFPPSPPRPAISSLPVPVRNIPPALPPSSPRSIPQAIDAHNRRIQSNGARMERQATASSYNSRNSVTSFSSLSSEDSNPDTTPISSVDNTPPHPFQEGQRGRSRYRQHRNGGDSVALEVARPQRSHYNPADRFIGIPPPAPDPVKAVPEAEMRRIEQRAYRDGAMHTHVMARSMPGGNTNSIQEPLVRQRSSHHHTSRYSLGGQDMDRLGDRLSRTSLGSDPKDHAESVRDPVIHYKQRGLPRRYRDGSENSDHWDNPEIRVPGSDRGAWRRQDAQRYMADRKRTDQDAWDLGTSEPLRYNESRRRPTSYYER